MKPAVVYRSKSGFARQYARWIAEELAADLFEGSKVTVETLTAYDTIIYGGGLYASGINGVKLITNHLDKLQGKKLVVFATGAAPGRAEELDHVRDSNFTQEQQKRIRFFYLRGGFDYSKLTWVDKLLIILLRLKIQWRKKRNVQLHPDEKGMLHACDQAVDFRRKTNISDLITFVRDERQ